MTLLNHAQIMFWILTVLHFLVDASSVAVLVVPNMIFPLPGAKIRATMPMFGVP